jgi:hypothetical protein
MTVTMPYRTATPKRAKKVPDYLIKEVIDGIPIYYKGYKKLLRNKETMGSSALKSVLCSFISISLISNLNERLYWVCANQVGCYLSDKDIHCYDCAVFEKTVLLPSMVGNHFTQVPAKLVIEVDTNIDNENMGDMDYIHRKSQKVLNFGTEKIIWIFTQSKKVLIATQDTPWTIQDWATDVLTIDGVTINVPAYLAEEKIPF